MNIDSIIAPYGRTVVRLLKGPVEATDTNAWEDILNYQSEINKYLMNIGIELIVKRDEGFAYISNMDELYATERFVSADELRERIEIFLPERFNRVKLLSEIDAYINRIVSLGYLKLIKRDNVNTYQIHRIIKEKVTLDKLQEFKDKLQEYVESV